MTHIQSLSKTIPKSNKKGDRLKYKHFYNILLHFNINLGYFLKFEVQISNLNLETQILELKIPKEIGPMKKIRHADKIPPTRK